MTPDKLAKSGTEHAHQVALFAYAAVARMHGFHIADKWAESKLLQHLVSFEVKVPALEWLHAIPNGGSRGDSVKSRKIHGAQLKAEGVRRGVPDIFLPWPNCGYSGLYIEMKKPSVKPKRESSKGGLSKEQIKFKNYALGVGFGFIVCYSWKEAAKALQGYIENDIER